MIEERQGGPPAGLASILSSLSSASAASASVASESVPGTASDSIQPTATSLGLPSSPASTNAGDAPTTTAFDVPVSTTDTSSSDPTATLQADESSANGGGLSEDAKIGLGVGLGVGLAALLALIAILCLMRRRKKRNLNMGKYTPQAQSDLSMVEAPAAAQHRNPPDDTYEPPKHFDEYQAFDLPPPAHHPAYETPVSAVAPSEMQIPAQRERFDAPPVLTIPEPERSPLHSIVPSPARGGSPVSPVSMSPVSPIGSRPPSPKYDR